MDKSEVVSAVSKIETSVFVKTCLLILHFPFHAYSSISLISANKCTQIVTYSH